MRWPFSNWRRGASGGEDPPDQDADDASAPDLATASPDAGPGPAAWRELPPIQRAVAEAPLTAPSAEFARDLAGRRPADRMIEPLGHALTADGPAGLVSGIATPLVQRASRDVAATPAGAMPVASPADRARGAGRRLVTSALLPRPMDATATTPGGAAPDGLPAEPADRPAGPAAVDAEVVEMPVAVGEPLVSMRALPVVEPLIVAQALGATRVADTTAPAPILAVARVVASAGTNATSVASVGSAQAAPSIPDGAPLPSPVPGSVSPLGASGDLGVERGGDLEQPVLARRTLGESRRLGLGAPLVGPPPSAARPGGRADMPVARLVRPVPPDPSTPAAPPPPGLPAATAAAMPLPRLAVARLSTSLAATPTGASPAGPEGPAELADESKSGETGASADHPAGEDEEAAGGRRADPTRPLVGDAAIVLSRQVMAGAGPGVDAADPAGPEGDALPLAPVPAPIRSGALPGTVAAASAVTRGGVDEETADWPAGPDRDTDPAGGSHASADPSPTGRTALMLAPLVAGRPMRATVASAPAVLGQGPATARAPVVARLAVPSTGARGLGADPVGAGAIGIDRPAIAAGRSAMIQGDLGASLDRTPVRLALAPTAPGRGDVGGGADPAPAALQALTLMRSATATVDADSRRAGEPGVAGWTGGARFSTMATAPGAFVQRAVEIGEMAVTSGGGSAAEAAAGDAGAAQGGGAEAAGTAGGPGTDYEELAEHVYDKIRARLTSELLLDRERAGMLVDG